jgi:large subunit ribosomal protein L29
MTKAIELRKLNDEELAHHLAESREEMFHLRFQLAMGKQDNSARLEHVRREVARSLTLQRQRQAGEGDPTATTGTRARARRAK